MLVALLLVHLRAWRRSWWSARCCSCRRSCSDRFADFAGPAVSRAAGAAGLLFVALYVLRQLARPAAAETGQLSTPLSVPADRRPPAARSGRSNCWPPRRSSISRCRPAGNPGYLAVLGIFVISFSAAQISHAPGGLGVLEVVFLAGLSDIDPVVGARRIAGVPAVLPDHPADRRTRRRGCLRESPVRQPLSRELLLEDRNRSVAVEPNRPPELRHRA